MRDFGLPCGHHLEQQQLVAWRNGRYFNAGLLLFNMRAWSEAEQTGVLHAVLEQFGFISCSGDGDSSSTAGTDRSSNSSTVPPAAASLRYADQDALNLLCAERGGWVELPARWNVQVSAVRVTGTGG